jgi:energy-coupling factor transporter transmembrane protein EcfT
VKTRVLAGREQVFGPWGHLAFLTWAIALSILASEARIVAVLGVVIACTALFWHGGLRPIRRPTFWFLVASALGLSPFFLGEKDVSLLGLSLSRQGFWIGVWMALRALSIALAVGDFAYAVSADEIARLFEGVGLRGLGFAVGVAFNLLPAMEGMARTTYDALRLRGGFRRERLQALRLLLVTILVNGLRRGDEVVEAAEARAFRPDGPRQGLPHPGQADLALAAVLAILGAGLVAWP